MPESAAVVLFFIIGEPHHDGGGRDRIELHDTASAACAAIGALDAVYKYRERVAGKPELSGTIVKGCWVERNRFFYILWDDGDTYRIPRSAMKPGRSL